MVEHQAGLLSQLTSMGFNAADVERVIATGASDVAQAVALLLDGANDTATRPDRPPSSPYDPGHAIFGVPDLLDIHVPGAPDNIHSANSPGQGESLNPTSTRPDPDAVVSLAPRTEDEMLQQALDISRLEAQMKDLQDDEDVDRVMAESMAATSNVQTPLAAWTQDPPVDPYDQIRTGFQTSVGLRNVGQTCYLNSLLQVYFHLAEFRKAILSFRNTQPTNNPTDYQPPMDTQTELDQHQQSEMLPPMQQNQPVPSHAYTKKIPSAVISQDVAAKFVSELQRLFAKMALTNTRHVDPSHLIEAMRGPNGKPIVIGDQQDAAEFNQIFLEMVELGISTDVSTGTPRTVNDLFAFDFVQEIVQHDESETRHVDRKGETNSFIVDAYKEGAETLQPPRGLYDGLDDYFETPIDLAVEGGTVETAIKRVWLSTLAPVFTIYLQRVRYDRATKAAEKVHSKFEFDEEVSLNRFMVDNKAATTKVRQRVDDLKKDIAGQADAEARLTLWGKGRIGDTPVEDEMDVAYQRVLDRLGKAIELDNQAESPLTIAHSTISGLRINDKNIIQDIRAKLKELRQAVGRAYDTIETYPKYQLFAVLVHDGDSASGHYLAFIRPSKQVAWVRFSDLAVSQVVPDVVRGASLGEQRDMSAYSLIYRRTKNDGETEAEPGCIAAESKELLPPELVDEIERDNREFLSLLGKSRAEKAKTIVSLAESRLRTLESSNDGNMADISVFSYQEGQKSLSAWFALSSEYTTCFGKYDRRSFANLVKERFDSIGPDSDSASAGNMITAIIAELHERWKDPACVIPEELRAWLDDPYAFGKAYEIQTEMVKTHGLFCIMLCLAGRAMSSSLDGNFMVACDQWDFLFSGNFAGYLPVEWKAADFKPSGSVSNLMSLWRDCHLFAAGCVLYTVVTSVRDGGNEWQRSALRRQIDGNLVTEEALDGLRQALGYESAAHIFQLSNVAHDSSSRSGLDATFVENLRVSWEVTQVGSNLYEGAPDSVPATLHHVWQDHCQASSAFTKVAPVGKYAESGMLERGRMLLEFWQHDGALK